MRKRIKKNSDRLVLHQLSTGNIKKNPNIEKEHVITKINQHEKLYTFYLSMIFLIVLLGVTFLIGTSLKDVLPFNSYSSGELLVEYNSTNNLIGNIITLTDADVVEDAKVEDSNHYTFTITNPSNYSVKYKIKIRDDDEFIELDQCRDRLFSEEDIKFNINHGNVFYLNTKKVGDYYLLAEEVIPANSTKVYTINIWLDNSTLLSDRHYHGIIEVDTVK